MSRIKLSRSLSPADCLEVAAASIIAVVGSTANMASEC
jgi:hypothetical protein